jgi:hypothetical protein
MCMLSLLMGNVVFGILGLGDSASVHLAHASREFLQEIAYTPLMMKGYVEG